MIKTAEYEVSKYILKKVNYVIYEILRFYNDLRETDDKGYLEELFPKHMIRENIQQCYETLNVMEEYLTDEYYHELDQVEARTLFYLLHWYLEATEDAEFNVEIDKEKVTTEDDMYIAKNINNVSSYLDFMFYDWDFLDEDLSNYLEIYFKIPEVVTDYFHVNLDEYIDLMPKDKREQYLKCKEKGTYNLNNDTEGIESIIIKEVFSAIKRREEDPKRLKSTSETQLSTDITDIISSNLKNYNIIAQREKPNGFALSSIGEDDIYLYSMNDGIYKPISVGENKIWGTYEKQIKQLLGYMNQSLKFGFTIIFNKNASLQHVLKKRREIIEKISVGQNQSFKLDEDIKNVESLDNVLVSTHRNPEDNRIFKIYHFIINCYLPEREEAAKEARRR